MAFSHAFLSAIIAKCNRKKIYGRLRNARRSTTRYRVCIFEDNTEIREFLSETVSLSEELFLVGAYPNANDVLRIIKKDKPDVVLMDIQMPGISGIEALKLIKVTTK